MIKNTFSSDISLLFSFQRTLTSDEERTDFMTGRSTEDDEDVEVTRKNLRKRHRAKTKSNIESLSMCRFDFIDQ